MWAFPSLITTVLLIELIIGFGRSGTKAQTLATTLTDTPTEADIVFGPDSPARVYSTREAVKWGADFLVSWSRAADRRILYGYKLANIDLDQLRELLRSESKVPNDTLLAIINEVPGGPLPILGYDKGYSAAPVLQVSATALQASNFDLDQYETQIKRYIIPNIVAVSSLKGAGKDVTNLESLFQTKTEAVTYIASNQEIPNLKIDKYFLVANSAWTGARTRPQLTWGMKIGKIKPPQ